MEEVDFTMSDRARDKQRHEHVERQGGYAPKGAADVSKLPKGPAPGGEPPSQGGSNDGKSS